MNYSDLTAHRDFFGQAICREQSESKRDMRYYEVKMHVAADATEIITGFLSNYGIDNFQVNDISSDETDIIFYLDENEESKALLQEIKISAMKLKSDELYGKYQDLGRMYVESDIVDDADWKDRWKKDFTSFRVSDRFGIKPSWDDNDPEGEFTIEIDPGMAFGTGAHETTRLCLQSLEETLEPGKSVLDIGTGSGILSIAAAMLGAGDIKSVDIDEDAIAVARENFERNNVLGDIDLSVADILEGVDFKADIIVANLITGLIIEIVSSLETNLNDGGVIILSGILTEEKNKILEALGENDYTPLEMREDGEWFMVKADLNE